MKKRILNGIYLLALSIVLYFLVENKVVLGISFAAFFLYAVLGFVNEIRGIKYWQKLLLSAADGLPAIVIFWALLK